jgi:hypothetical protein
MALPTFVAAGTLASGTGNITPALPGGYAANDIFLLFVESANQTIAVPTAGWAEVTGSPQGTGTAGGTAATRLAVFWKRAIAGDTAPTVTDPGDHAVGRVLAFRGCVASGNPWDITAGDVDTTADTSGSIPGATTTSPDTLIVLAVSNGTDTTTAQASGWTNASLAGILERIDSNATASNGGGFAVATGGKAVAGAYSATSVTLATASVKGLLSIALKPLAVDANNTPGVAISRSLPQSPTPEVGVSIQPEYARSFAQTLSPQVWIEFNPVAVVGNFTAQVPLAEGGTGGTDVNPTLNAVVSVATAQNPVIDASGNVNVSPDEARMVAIPQPPQIDVEAILSIITAKSIPRDPLSGPADKYVMLRNA